MKIESGLSKQAWARKLNSRSKIHTEASKGTQESIENFKVKSTPRLTWKEDRETTKDVGEGLVFKPRLHFFN